jgi:hypothetical protein
VTTPEPDYECGDWPDGCGGSVNCDTDGKTCDERVLSGEVCAAGQCSEGGTLGDPYVFVTPADIGFRVGVGVIAPAPTQVFTDWIHGNCTLRDQVVENVIINCTTVSLKIQQNVTIRNSILNMTPDRAGPGNVQNCVFMDRFIGSESPNFLLEYSEVKCIGPDPVKMFTAFDDKGDGGDDHSNWVMRNNVFRQDYPNDFMYIEGNLDGFLVEYNVFTGMVGFDPLFESDAHFDVFQIGEGDASEAYGTLTIRGNHFDNYMKMTHKTAILFGTGPDNRTDVIFESNYNDWWGLRNNWSTSGATVAYRYNIFSDAFQQVVGTRCSSGSPECPPEYWLQDICCGYPMQGITNEDAVAIAECNRYEDGTFLEDQYIQDTQDPPMVHKTTGCPPYTRP